MLIQNNDNHVFKLSQVFLPLFMLLTICAIGSFLYQTWVDSGKTHRYNRIINQAEVFCHEKTERFNSIDDNGIVLKAICSDGREISQSRR